MTYMTQSEARAAEPTIDPSRRYLCRHVFTGGHRCGSPSLRGQDLCYYHVRSRRNAECANHAGTFVMSRVDDRASVQLAIYDVLSRIAGGDIEYKRGSILLYGLQIASSNLSRQEKLAEQLPQVEEIISDYNLGDLAPILEIPTEESPATEARVPNPGSACEGGIPPAPTHKTVIPSEPRSAQPKDHALVTVPLRSLALTLVAAASPAQPASSEAEPATGDWQRPDPFARSVKHSVRNRRQNRWKGRLA